VRISPKGRLRDGQLHFSRNLRENANARGIWQQWPWSADPILRVGFSLSSARERERERERVAWRGSRAELAGERGRQEEEKGWGGKRMASFAGHAKQPEVRAVAAAAAAVAATPTTDLGYIPALPTP